MRGKRPSGRFLAWARWTALLLALIGAPDGLATAEERPDFLLQEGVQKINSGEFEGAAALLERALALFRQAGDPAGEAKTLKELGNAYYGLGEYRRAIEASKQSRELSRDLLHDSDLEARALSNTGRALQALGLHDQAVLAYQETLSLARQERNDKVQGIVLSNLVLLSMEREEHAQAVHWLQEMREAVRRDGSREGEAWVLVHLGLAHSRLGNRELAIASFGEAAERARELGNLAGQAAALDGKALELYKAGDLDAAAEVGRQVLAITQATGNLATAAEAMRRLMLIHLTRWELPELKSVALKAREVARQIPDAELEEAAVGNLSRAQASLGEEDAGASYRELLTLARQSGNFQHASEALGYLGGVASLRGDHAGAAELYRQLLELARQASDRAVEGQALAGIGEAYDALGRSSEALEALQQGLVIAREVGDELGEAHALRKLGIASLKRGEILAGMDFLDQGLALTERVIAGWERGGKVGGQEEARAALRQGLRVMSSHLLDIVDLIYADDASGEPAASAPLASAGGATEEARRIMGRALDRARRLDERGSEARILGSLAQLAMRRQDLAAATATAMEALEAARASHQEDAEAVALLVLATVHQDHDLALRYGKEGLALAERRSDRRGQASMLAMLGATALQKRDTGAAIEWGQKAVTLARELQLLDVQRLAVGVLSTASSLLLDYEAVLQWSTEEVRLARLANDRLGEADGHRSLGTAHQALGDHLRAIHHCRLGIDDADPRKAALAHNCIALSYMTLGDVPRAGESARQAVESATAVGDQALLLSARATQGQCLLLAGELEKAADLGLQVAEVWAQAEDAQGKAMAEVLRGQARALRKDPHGAISHFERALRLFETDGASGADRIREELRLAVSSLLVSQYLASGEAGKGLEHARKGWEASAGSSVSERRAAALSDLGHALFVAGRTAEAQDALHRAVGEWEKARELLGPEAGLEKVGLLGTQALTYELLQEVLVASGKAEEALEIAERGRARTFIEALSARGRPASAALPTVAGFRQLAREKNATLVEYSILYEQLEVLLPARTEGAQPGLEKSLFIWVVRPTGEIRLRTVDLAKLRQDERVSLSGLVLGFRESISGRGRGTSLLPSVSEKAPLRRLHRLLIEPIADLLPREEQAPVVFVPQGPLFLVPFAALQDAAGRYLVEEHTILLSPSIEALSAIRPVTGQTLWAPGDALVVGNPKIAAELTVEPYDLPDLPGAESEAEAIACELEVEPLLGEKATRGAVLRLLPDRRLVHLATHGFAERLGDRDIPGALALAANGADDGLLTAREILDLSLRADLVVLSACDTGRGRITSDGLVGLSRSLIEAGAANVVVSLWSIPDAPTSRLMTELYRRLRGGAGAAEALRQAMLERIRRRDAPEAWGAFVLIGGLGLTTAPPPPLSPAGTPR